MDYAALQTENQALREQNELLRRELAEFKRLIYGSKRERFVGTTAPGQLSWLTDETPTVATNRQQQTYQRSVANTVAATPPSRKLLPPHLPRVEVVLEPDEDTSMMKKIGEQVSEELDADGQSTSLLNCLCAVMCGLAM